MIYVGIQNGRASTKKELETGVGRGERGKENTKISTQKAWLYHGASVQVLADTVSILSYAHLSRPIK